MLLRSPNINKEDEWKNRNKINDFVSFSRGSAFLKCFFMQ